MNQNKTKKSKINPASLLKNQSNPLKKTAKAILFFFEKSSSHEHDQNDRTTKYVMHTRESKREKSKSWPLPIEKFICYIIHQTIKFI